MSDNPFNPKLTEAQIRQIMVLRRQGHGAYKIAKHSTVKHVVQGRSWIHITGGKLIKGASE